MVVGSAVQALVAPHAPISLSVSQPLAGTRPDLHLLIVWRGLVGGGAPRTLRWPPLVHNVGGLGSGGPVSGAGARAFAPPLLYPVIHLQGEMD